MRGHVFLTTNFSASRITALDLAPFEVAMNLMYVSPHIADLELEVLSNIDIIIYVLDFKLGSLI